MINIEEAKKWLGQAIKRHERHMNGSEATSQKSQMTMMEEMRTAMNHLKSDPVMMRKAEEADEFNFLHKNGGLLALRRDDPEKYCRLHFSRYGVMPRL